MQCPVCKSVKIESHAVQPVRYSGINAVSHYSCNRCGVMFVKTEFDSDQKDEQIVLTVEDGRPQPSVVFKHKAIKAKIRIITDEGSTN